MACKDVDFLATGECYVAKGLTPCSLAEQPLKQEAQGNGYPHSAFQFWLVLFHTTTFFLTPHSKLPQYQTQPATTNLSDLPNRKNALLVRLLFLPACASRLKKKIAMPGEAVGRV